MAFKSKDITLGSGNFYMLPKDDTNSTIPDIETIAVDDNNIGHIKSGFTATYGVTETTDKDDLMLVEKSVLTDETATVKLGLITWNGDTLKKVLRTAEVSEDDTAKTRTTDIGGLSEASDDEYWCCFVPEDKDRILGVIFLGIPITSLELAFAQGESAKIEPEFRALPFNDKGKKFRIVETTA